ncbi:hypothetical protein BaRGS_00014219 [Batillaria attramentaria]|uniref:BHLH domain-containing protein n=1 Tax=Batillaria attramentaria TaxID=370345 RepID=A0ABD0L5J1_9CAEN
MKPPNTKSGDPFLLGDCTSYTTQSQPAFLVQKERQFSIPVPGSRPSSVMRQSSRPATAGEVKEKRKCGRPRNPIPRHKRVSHINAEHRRRGKIQNAFQTLKNMVPKYESSGRDSKADILFKAVEHSRRLQEECREQEKELKKLRNEQKCLNADIERYQTNLPEGQLFEEQPLTATQRLDDLINTRAADNWRYWIVSFTKHISKGALCNISTTTKILTEPQSLESEARQHGIKPVRHSSVSCQEHVFKISLKQELEEGGFPPPTGRKSCPRRGQQQLRHELRTSTSFKTESKYSPCSMAIDLCLGGFDSPPGHDSTSPIDLSPPGSSYYDSTSAYSDMQDCESSSVDQGYDTPSILDSPSYFYQHPSPSPLTEHHASDLDQHNSPSPDAVEAAYTSSPEFQLSCPPGLQRSLHVQQQQTAVDESDFLEQMNTHSLLDPTDCHLLIDPSDRQLLEHHLLDTTTDAGHPFDFSVLDYDTEDLSMSLPCYTNL